MYQHVVFDTCMARGGSPVPGRQSSRIIDLSLGRRFLSRNIYERDGEDNRSLVSQSCTGCRNRKGDPDAKAVAVNQSPVAVLAAASETTGLPRGTFEIQEISKAEFDALRSERSE
jgi:hypothetical protein